MPSLSSSMMFRTVPTEMLCLSAISLSRPPRIHSQTTLLRTLSSILLGNSRQEHPKQREPVLRLLYLYGHYRSRDAALWPDRAWKVQANQCRLLALHSNHILHVSCNCTLKH